MMGNRRTGYAPNVSVTLDEVGAGMEAITVREGFLAMGLFVDRFAREAGDDLATLIADITIEPDGMPVDPAAWDDWLDCVRRAKAPGA